MKTNMFTCKAFTNNVGGFGIERVKKKMFRTKSLHDVSSASSIKLIFTAHVIIMKMYINYTYPAMDALKHKKTHLLGLQKKNTHSYIKCKHSCIIQVKYIVHAIVLQARSIGISSLPLTHLRLRPCIISLYDSMFQCYQRSYNTFLT